MASPISDWIEKRFPYREIASLGRDEEIPGGASFFYALGSATLFVFVIQVMTGIWQLFYYVPTVDHAYDSLSYLRTEIAFGWLVHGLHYWGANLMSVLVGLHVIRVFVWGAYKDPRQVTWLTGVVLFLVTAALVFTGSPLPWDEAGYWVATVGTSIMGTVPLVGATLADVLRGGGSLGPIALSRFFALHAAILPAVLVGLIGLHMVAFRQFGSVGPWKAEKRTTSGPFWPDQIFKDLVLATLLLLLLVWLAAYHPAPITGPADPTDTSYRPTPEWNFLFLFEALKFLPGKLEPLGTVGIPGLAVILLVGLPFYDRNPERAPARRPIAMAALVATLAVLSTLTIAALRSADSVATVAAKAPAKAGKRSASVVAGQKLFDSMGCSACHRVQGKGGSAGPDLTNVGTQRSRSWLVTQITDPGKHFPQGMMPAFASLAPAQANQIVDFLLSLSGAAQDGSAAAAPAASAPARTAAPAAPGTTAVAPPAAVAPASAAAAPAAAAAGQPASAASGATVHAALGPPGRAAAIVGSAEHGAVLFDIDCAGCHGAGGRGGIANPGSAAGKVPALVPIAAAIRSDDPVQFAESLDRYLQYGAGPVAGGALQMPVFGKSGTLSQQEIADLEAWIMQQNGVDRAEILTPGVAPRRYFGLATAASGLVGLLLAAAWVVVRRRARQPAAP